MHYHSDNHNTVDTDEPKCQTISLGEVSHESIGHIIYYKCYIKIEYCDYTVIMNLNHNFQFLHM